MGLTREQEVNYCALSDARPRFDLALSQYKSVAVDTRKVLILDDAVVSGATLWAIQTALNHQDIAVRSVAIVDVVTDDFAVEQVLNDSEDDIEATVSLILNNPEAQLTTRTLKKILRWSDERLRRVLGHLPLVRVAEVLKVAQSSQRIQREIGEEKFNEFQRAVKAL